MSFEVEGEALAAVEAATAKRAAEASPLKSARDSAECSASALPPPPPPAPSPSSLGGGDDDLTQKLASPAATSASPPSIRAPVRPNSRAASAEKRRGEKKGREPPRLLLLRPSPLRS